LVHGHCILSTPCCVAHVDSHFHNLSSLAFCLLGSSKSIDIMSSFKAINKRHINLYIVHINWFFHNEFISPMSILVQMTHGSKCL
jgi:hypothetical protein